MSSTFDGNTDDITHLLPRHDSPGRAVELRIGIGVHTGEAIVGTMGPPSSPNLSAIGDNINIAARLEAMCEPLDCDVVVSEATAKYANVDLSEHPCETVEVRGREEPVRVYVTCDVEDFGV